MRRIDSRDGGRLAILIALVVAPLALGGAHPLTNALLAVLLVTAAAWGLYDRGHRTSWRGAWVVWLVAAVWLATALQLVPLPLGLYRAVSPGTYLALRLSYPEGSWAPVSQDLPATAHELTKISALLAAAVLVHTKLRRERLSRLCGAIALSGGVVLALTIAQTLAGFTQPYGLRHVPPVPLPTSFINSNHQSGYLGLVAFAALAWAFEAGRVWRRVAVVLALGASIAVLASLSRGGIVAFAAAAGFFTVTLFLGRRSDAPLRGTAIALAVGAILVVLAGLTFTSAADEMATLAEAHRFDKTQIWSAVPNLLVDHPFLGIGRGALSGVYGRYAAIASLATFTHVENEWLQALVDWGPIFGSLFVAGLIACFVRALWRGLGSSTHAAALAALFFVGAHNLVDFNTTLAAVALPAVLLLAALQRRNRNQDDPRRRGSRSEGGAGGDGSRVRRGSAWAGVPVVVLLGGYATLRDIGRDTVALAARLEEVPATEARIIATPFVQRHPADFALPLLVAQRQLHERGGAAGALKSINAAMVLAPHQAAPHGLAGQALWRLGKRDQALLEYGLAIEKNPERSVQWAREVLTLGRDPRLLLRLDRGDALGRERLAAFLLGEGADGVVVELFAGSELSTAAAAELLASALLRLGRYDQAIDAARRASSLDPSRATPYDVQAGALMARGDREGALAALERGLAHTSNPSGLYYRRGVFLMQMDRLHEAHEAAATARSLQTSGPFLASAKWLEGAIYEKEQRLPLAIQAYEQATTSNPKRAEYWLALIKARLRIGDSAGATRTRNQALASGIPALELSEVAAQLGEANPPPAPDKTP